MTGLRASYKPTSDVGQRVISLLKEFFVHGDVALHLLGDPVFGVDRLHRASGSQAAQSMHSSGLIRNWSGVRGFPSSASFT